MDLTTTLPPELLTLIANWLPSRADAVRFALTCRIAHSSAKNQLAQAMYEPITAILAGQQTLYLKADQTKPWRGCWMTEYHGRISFGGGCSVHKTWYGEYSVLDVCDTDSGKTISLKMVIVSLRTKEYQRGDRGPNYDSHCRIEETYRGDFHIPSSKDSSITGQIDRLFVPEYAKGWDKYYRGSVTGKYSFNPSPSAEMQETLNTLDSVVDEEKTNEAKRKEESERFEKRWAEQKQKEKEDAERRKNERERQKKEEEERKQQEIEEQKRKEEARTKFSYEELKAFVAAKDERILEALKEAKILTHLREDAYPVAFGGKSKEEVDALPKWTLKSLIQHAGLF